MTAKRRGSIRRKREEKAKRIKSIAFGYKWADRYDTVDKNTTPMNRWEDLGVKMQTHEDGAGVGVAGVGGGDIISFEPDFRRNLRDRFLAFSLQSEEDF